jgi:hypothetical protein
MNRWWGVLPKEPKNPIWANFPFFARSMPSSHCTISFPPHPTPQCPFTLASALPPEEGRGKRTRQRARGCAVVMIEEGNVIQGLICANHTFSQESIKIITCWVLDGRERREPHTHTQQRPPSTATKGLATASPPTEGVGRVGPCRRHTLDVRNESPSFDLTIVLWGVGGGCHGKGGHSPSRLKRFVSSSW